MEYEGFNEYKQGSADAEYDLKKANIYYVGKFLFVAILCFILYNTGNTWLGKLVSTSLTGKIDIGITLVARTTAAMALWFLIHGILMIGNPDVHQSCQFMIHISWPALHTLIFFVIWIVFWRLPDSVFTSYIELAKYCSFAYLLIQIFFLVTLFHDLNQEWVTDDNVNCMIGLTAFLSLGSITVFSLCYYYFCPSDCQGNVMIITTNLCLTIFLFLLSIFIEEGSIFTSSLVSCYVAYLTSAGLMCAENCTRVSLNTSGATYKIVASMFTLIWMSYSAFSASYKFTLCDCSEDDKKPFFSLSFFHTVFTLASMYLTMIVTSWGRQGETSTSWSTDRGLTSKWVNISASWVTMILYFWSLIAPKCCPDRDFS